MNRIVKYWSIIHKKMEDPEADDQVYSSPNSFLQSLWEGKVSGKGVMRQLHVAVTLQVVWSELYTGDSGEKTPKNTKHKAVGRNPKLRHKPRNKNYSGSSAPNSMQL